MAETVHDAFVHGQRRRPARSPQLQRLMANPFRRQQLSEAERRRWRQRLREQRTPRHPGGVLMVPLGTRG